MIIKNYKTMHIYIFLLIYNDDFDIILTVTGGKNKWQQSELKHFLLQNGKRK